MFISEECRARNEAVYSDENSILSISKYKLMSVACAVEQVGIQGGIHLPYFKGSNPMYL